MKDDPRLVEARELEQRAKELRNSYAEDEVTEILDLLREAIKKIQACQKPGWNNQPWGNGDTMRDYFAEQLDSLMYEMMSNK